MGKVKNKKIIGIFAIIILSIIVFGGKIYMENEKQKQDDQQIAKVVEMEITTAKQIKNTFTDITEIRFSKEYSENNLSGYTDVMVKIITNSGDVSDIGVSLSKHSKSKEIRSYTGKVELKRGKTTNKVKVVFSNKNESSL